MCVIVPKGTILSTSSVGIIQKEFYADALRTPIQKGTSFAKRSKFRFFQQKDMSFHLYFRHKPVRRCAVVRAPDSSSNR